MANVLVVDDDADSCEAMARFLTKTGHSGRCVPNDREALAALVAAVPDYIVLDVRMPVMDGITLVEVIRSYLRWATIPVAIVTAYPEDARLTHLEGLGVRQVFQKSQFTFEDLLEWMARSGNVTSPSRSSPPPPYVGH